MFATDNLSFDASASYLNFAYTSPTDASGNLVNTSIPGSAITPYTPKLAYAVGAQYEQPISSGKITYRLDGSFQGKVFTTGENSPWSVVDSRFLANARAIWGSSTSELTVPWTWPPASTPWQITRSAPASSAARPAASVPTG